VKAKWFSSSNSASSFKSSSSSKMSQGKLAIPPSVYPTLHTLSKLHESSRFIISSQSLKYSLAFVG
jgi:hypothetical protein